MFYHSLLSDWNHGNAHFLRGVVSELKALGHEVRVYEPRDAWSVQNLVRERGPAALTEYRRAYPQLSSIRYSLANLDLDEALDDADLVLVHEWNDHGLVARIGAHRARTGRYVLLFHDTHHRSVTDPTGIQAYDLRHYDGVLAFGEVIRELYLQNGWTARAWTWHEAADTRVFRPMGSRACVLASDDGGQPEEDSLDGDLVWIGNWGDGERTAELHEFLLEPVRALKLRCKVHGVRYPQEARAALAAAGIQYGGWLPNYEVPAAFARCRVTVHIPRRPYVRALPGIPTIRPFEALACGIPLISAPWEDREGLFTPGRDFLVARSGAEMRRHLRTLLNEPAAAREVAGHGLQTLRRRHTCAHRVAELLGIYQELHGTRVPQRSAPSHASSLQTAVTA